MIISKTGNLFDHVQGKPDAVQVVIHSCNAQGVMGSGIAKTVKELYPSAFDAYAESLKQYQTGFQALGTVSSVLLTELDDPVFIFNLIGQLRYGKDGKKYTSYDAIDAGLMEIDRQFSTLDIPIEFHFPSIGCGLGGGNWGVVSQIILHRLNRNHYTLNHWSL